MDNKTSEIGAFIITMLLTLALLLLLWFTNVRLKYPPEGMEHLLQREDSIFVEELGGEEFVKLGDIPEPTESNQTEETASENNTDNVNDEPKVEGDDREDAGQVSPVQPTPVTSKAPSPMKVKTEDTKPAVKPGAAKPNPKPATAKPAVKRATASSTSNAISSKMKNAFGAKGSGKGQTQGSPTGNASSGVMQGHASLGGGLVGYTKEKFGRPHSPYIGSVTVQVHVNTRGKVTQARAISGTGLAWASEAVRRDCEKESLASAFSVPKNRTTEGIGTITWRFK